MDLTIILSVLGLILTALSIILLFYNYYKAKITFIFENSIPLFDSLTNSFNGLSIKYKDNTINQGLILISGYLVNDGKKDINKNMIDEPLSILFSSDYKIHEINISDKSEGFEPKIEVDEDQTKIVIDWTLFRKNEYLKIEILIEIPIEQISNNRSEINLKYQIQNNLKFYHRISDTEKINFLDYQTLIKYDPIYTIRENKFLNGKLGIATGIFTFIIIPFLVLEFLLHSNTITTEPELKKEIRYVYDIDSLTNIEASIEIINDSTIKVYSQNNSFEELINVFDFFHLKKWKPKIHIEPLRPKYDLSAILWMILIFEVIMIFVFFRIIFFFKDHRLRKIIKNYLKSQKS